MKVTRRELLQGIATAGLTAVAARQAREQDRLSQSLTGEADETLSRDNALLKNDLGALKRDQILLNAINRTRREVGLAPLGVPRPAPEKKKGTSA